MSAHLMILPVVVPLLVGALLLWVEPRYPRFARWLSGASVLALLVLAMVLLRQADSGQVSAYLLGNWQAPFGIALALDRLSALMLLLTASVATLAWIYSRAREVKQGAHFDALFQFQLMGLNGAFLTADVFNLFVFFEVLLIASYGLLLHGADRERLKAAMHYVAFNVTGSALFLIAASLLYGLTGTLNMADLGASWWLCRSRIRRWHRRRVCCWWWFLRSRRRCCRSTSGCRVPTLPQQPPLRPCSRS